MMGINSVKEVGGISRNQKRKSQKSKKQDQMNQREKNSMKGFTQNINGKKCPSQ